jgi:DNA-binding NtrC family response regulator
MGTTTKGVSILVCDDEARFRAMLEQALREDGHTVTTVGDGHAAIGALAKGDFDLVITDMRMPGLDGFAVLEAARKAPSRPAAVAITGYASIDETVLAIRHGAADYLAKPFPIDRLLEVVATVTRDRASAARRTPPPREHAEAAAAGSEHGYAGFVGESAPMRAVYARLLRFAPLDATVLIQGETGTGKELAAAALHDLSHRKRKALVRVNCANIERSLFESALFGHVRGSFTGAIGDQGGLFHAADGGTIFLDEVGEIPLDLQAKLLRVIERKEFLRIGGTTPEHVDARIVAATNRDLEKAAKKGRFREDLYFRLSGFVLEIPPLRERREDVPLLVEHFLDLACRGAPGPAGPAALGAAGGARSAEAGRPPLDVSPEAMGRLVAYDWPGNVRELENTVRALVACANGPRIEKDDLPARVAALAPRDLTAGVGQPSVLPLDYHTAKARLLEAFERRYFAELVASHGQNVSSAARAAGLDRKSLREKLKKLGLSLRGGEDTPEPTGAPSDA